MSVFWFDVFHTLGFFSVMLVAMAVSIVCAKTKTGVFIYIAGIVVQFLSLISMSSYYHIVRLLVYFLLYVAIFCITAFFIIKRRGR